MKKGIKKLTLNRETLRELDRLHLEEAAGGTGDTATFCCSGRPTCASCVLTCGSRLC